MSASLVPIPVRSSSSRSPVVALVVLLAVVALAPPALASPFPDSEPGRRLAALVQALRSPEGREERLRANLAEEMLDAIPMADHVAFFAQTGAELGDFEVVGVRESSPEALVLDLRSESGEEHRYLVEFLPQAPHGMIGWMPMAVVDLGALDPHDPVALDRGLRTLAADGELAGVVRIEDGGRLVFERAYGEADRQHRVPNTVDTLFHLASITKLVTRAAVVLLVQDGLLDLGAPVGGLLPELPPELGRITPWQLLRHESGLGEVWSEPSWQRVRFETDRLDAMIGVLAGLDLAFEPGTDRRYSNAGYVALGLLIERSTGEAWTDFVRRRIFEPSGMLDSDFVQPTLVTERRFARGYTNLAPAGPAEGYRRTNAFTFGVAGTPAGGAWSTAADLARFDDALRSDVLFDAEHRRLFHALDRAEDEAAARSDREPPGVLAAAGGAPGVSTVLLSDPDARRRVIVLSNLDERLGEQLGVHLYRRLSESGSARGDG